MRHKQGDQEIANFFQAIKTVAKAKKCQQISIKALFESLKYLLQNTFETLKYLQQTMIQNCLFRQKGKTNCRSKK